MFLFCQHNGFPDLLKTISVRMTDCYIANKESYQRLLPNEKKREKEIRKMVLYGIFKNGRGVKLTQKLYIVSPNIYHFLLRTKKKLYMILKCK